MYKHFLRVGQALVVHKTIRYEGKLSSLADAVPEKIRKYQGVSLGGDKCQK